MRAAMPLGAPNLWPTMVIISTPLIEGLSQGFCPHFALCYEEGEEEEEEYIIYMTTHTSYHTIHYLSHKLYTYMYVHVDNFLLVVSYRKEGIYITK